MSTDASQAEQVPEPYTSPPLVCVQGLGFVGTAMALAAASARGPEGPAYRVVGVELDTPQGRRTVEELNAGRLPIQSTDQRMGEALAEARAAGNLEATVDPAAYESADVVVVSINFDLTLDNGRPTVDFEGLRAAVRVASERMPAGSLLVLETTVPPGTTEHVVAPEVDAVLERRGLGPDAILLAYAYERVMPGPGYLDSLMNYWRVYAGRTPSAAAACEAFLSRVIDVERYPLTRVASTTAAELGKVLENSYRSATIAFMEEWGRFAEAIGVDLFEVVDAIRVRPSHSNIRQPGFGVGGYCLTKDPLFAGIAARELFGLHDARFEFSERAVELNDAMPLVTLAAVERLLDGLEGRRLLLLGASYRDGVDDTRSSPSAAFAGAAVTRGAEVVCHDPLVREWEVDVPLVNELPAPEGFDAVIFAVGHEAYRNLDLPRWLAAARPLVVDAHAVLSADDLAAAAHAGCRVWGIGRGEVTA
jgi:nucleotide sugar dehydrogenase